MFNRTDSIVVIVKQVNTPYIELMLKLVNKYPTVTGELIRSLLHAAHTSELYSVLDCIWLV